jgi:phage terminase large subunit-like protein
MDFFAAGVEHGERAFVAANRSGKSTAAGYEMALHLTGRYPLWWTGRRFDRAIASWAAGEDIRSMRESLQPLLFGDVGSLGTGMIPGDDIIGQPTMGRGVPDSIDSAAIRHVSGGASRIVLKTYEQGREAFQAAKIDVGWCDEEPPKPIYTEMLTRLMSTDPSQPNGTMMCTFTPLKGMSEVVMDFLGDDWRRPDVNA